MALIARNRVSRYLWRQWSRGLASKALKTEAEPGKIADEGAEVDAKVDLDLSEAVKQGPIRPSGQELLAKDQPGILDRIFPYDKIAQKLIGNHKDIRNSWMFKLMGANSAYTKRQVCAYRTWESIRGLCEGGRLLPMLRLPNEDQDKFLTWWELCALHVWLVVRRSRLGAGDERKLTAAINELMWTEVEARMYNEEGLPYMQLSKWTKELQKTWYARSLLLDVALEKQDFYEMDNILLRNMTCLKNDRSRAIRLRAYILAELRRIQDVSTEEWLQSTLFPVGLKLQTQTADAGLKRMDA